MQKKGFIYHLVTPAAWRKAMEEGRYRPQSLISEGFIHLSTEVQVLESAALHFADFEALIVLRVVVKQVRNQLKWEVGRNDEEFPHLYGELPWEAIETTLELKRLPDGSFAWDD